MTPDEATIIRRRVAERIGDDLADLLPHMQYGEAYDRYIADRCDWAAHFAREDRGTERIVQEIERARKRLDSLGPAQTTTWACPGCGLLFTEPPEDIIDGDPFCATCVAEIEAEAEEA